MADHVVNFNSFDRFTDIGRCAAGRDVNAKMECKIRIFGAEHIVQLIGQYVRIAPIITAIDLKQY